MYSVKIKKQTKTEKLERLLETLNESLKYSNDNWNSEERNPAMLVGYLEATIRHSIYELEKEIDVINDTLTRKQFQVEEK